jgi:membrane-associated protein
LSDSKYIGQPVGILVILLVVAAVAGTSAGYYFGAWAGDRLKNRTENLFYRKKYLELADSFYRKYGLMAFVVGRFLPIIRTFVPILSGMVKIPFAKFFFYNVLGAVCWICSMVLSGYFLGNLFPNLIDHVEYVIIGLIILTAIPVIITYGKNSGAGIN